MSAARVAAVDLGASSGRVVLGSVGPGRLSLEVVARFGNDPVRLPDGLHWNVVELFARSLAGLRAARVAAGADGLSSVGVDSWAIDYGLLRQGRLLGQPFHYRDEGRVAGVQRVHAEVGPSALFERNGLQHLPFTTLFQLAADPFAELADRLLLIPDLLGSWLRGPGAADVAERTNASTTGLLDVRSGTWDTGLARLVGLADGALADLVDPGTVLGPLSGHVGASIGAAGVPLVTVGSHDTASAVVGVPMAGDDAAYLSCGTWGLVGVETEKPVLTDAARAANFTNEGGVDGRVRFLTNVMGTWMLSESLRTWEGAGSAEDLTALLAAAADLTDPVPLVDVHDPRFLPPGDMPARVADWCVEHGLEPPRSRPALVRCLVESLADGFATAVRRAGSLSGREVRRVHLVGGGARNALLCQRLADRLELPVVAGPVEATAVGNVLVQARALGAVHGSLEDLRRLAASVEDLRTYRPRARRASESSRMGR